MDFRVIKAVTEADKKKAFQIREEVFVVEQQVAENEEFDAFEDESHHFVALNALNEPVGSARWRRTSKGIKLERFTVKQTLRGKGLGSRIVEAVLQDIEKHAKAGTTCTCTHSWTQSHFTPSLVFSSRGISLMNAGFSTTSCGKNYKTVVY